MLSVSALARPIRVISLVLAFAVMMSTLTSVQASADPQMGAYDPGESYTYAEMEEMVPGGSAVLQDSSLFLEGLRDLEDSNATKRVISGSGGIEGYEYEIEAQEGQHFYLTLPSAAAFAELMRIDARGGAAAGEVIDGATMEPSVSVRLKGTKVAVGFSPRDQNILKNAWLSGIITAGICAVPGVGWAACAVAGIAVSIAVSYISKRGVCSNRRWLWWYDIRNGSTIQCRSTRPW